MATDERNEYDPRHPHEPEVPPTFDSEGRCLVCGLMVSVEDRACRDERQRVLTELRAPLYSEDDTLGVAVMEVIAAEFGACSGALAGDVLEAVASVLGSEKAGDRKTESIAHPAAAASASKEEGTWRCPGCGSRYVRDVGKCGQLKPFVCEERVMSPAVERAARAIALAAGDGVFDEFDEARAGRDVGAEDRAYYAKLAHAALSAPSSVSRQGTEERDFDASEIEIDQPPYVLRPGPVVTNSAVRVRHKPTGVTVICDEDKSQLENKSEALRRLRLILAFVPSQQEGGRDA